MLTFQRLVASRYFALGKPRTWRAFTPSFAVAIVWIVTDLMTYVLLHGHGARVQELRASYYQYFSIALTISTALNVLVWAFNAMIYRLNIFTSISVYGLFLGSAALVIVLSVMSGFEHDLKRKILGTNAHIVVTRIDQPFTDYAAVRQKLAAVPGVIGATPYVMNEVMISSQSNLSGVVVKGIDPATVGQVTDLVRNTDVGGLDYLVAPEKLKGVGGPPLFHDDDLVGKDADAPRAHDAPKTHDAPKAHDTNKGAEAPSAGGHPAVEPRDARAYDGDGEDRPPAGAVHFAPADPHDKPAARDEPGAGRRLVPGVIIGRELARNLRLYLGDDVNIVSPFGGIGPSGPIPKSKPFRVAGIFFSGMFEYDTKYVYIALPAAQKFFNMSDEATGVELKVADPEHTEAIDAAVQRIVGTGYEVQDWKQLNRSLFSALKIEKILMFVLLCFIILVAAFSIIANGTMLVMEKGREVAILKSMGASDGAILGAFMLLGLIIGGLGTVSGIVVGVLACLALAHFGIPLNTDVYYITQLPVKMNPYEIVAVFFAALAIALLATLYPAWMAARLRPVEGLRDSTR